MTAEKDESPAADWIHLPSACEKLSLYVSLHDGELRRCASDLAARTIILDIDVPHLEAAGSPFVITVGNVASVRAAVSVRPPGVFEIPPGKSAEEQQRLLAAYWETWREQSLGWEEFEAALATDPLMISDASLAQGEGQATLHIGGFLDGDRFDDQYATAIVRGERISIGSTRGESLTIEEFMAIGQRYWDRFGRTNG